ncbi:glycosyltransferase [Bacillus salinus]|uniref:glycosyltransferase n=1 Tax=Bacillus sp. HMF5848 TaxID=2495421 RepID=UPI00163AA0E7|nr:glycosyltransferase [Bacillus sp. HMF5848]
MKILHYSLGLPPSRSGGLVRYAIDLMEDQARVKGTTIFHLYPGSIDPLNKRTRITKTKKVVSNATHFQIINSLPLPLFRGIKHPEDFMLSGPYEEYFNFLKDVNPDIIHVHTLMGVHKEFFESAKNLGIKTVYTTHDYFGICPTINLYKDSLKKNCGNFEQGAGCVKCNTNAMSTSSLFLTQTPLYPLLRNLKKWIKKNAVNHDIPINLDKKDINREEADKYFQLREFYFDIFNKIDVFHFNSSISEGVFRRYLPNINGKVLNITHNGIKDVNYSLHNVSSKIRLGYLGPMKEYKGFNLVLDAVKLLPFDKYDLHLYGDEGDFELPKNVFLHGKYSHKELDSVFSNIDVLIVPSIWYETFGFIVLEALNHGIPTIVSDTVGSKDLVKEDYGWVYNSNRLSDLVELVNSIDQNAVNLKKCNIKNNFKAITIKNHSENIILSLYKENDLN